MDWTDYFLRPDPRCVVAKELSILDLLEDEPPEPKEEEKPEGWDEFLAEVYEGGKKKVKNPNPETSKQYPEVQVSTALQNDDFRAQVHKEFEAWKAKKAEPKEEPSEKTEPEKPKPNKPKKKPVKVGEPITSLDQLQANMWVRNAQGILARITKVMADGTIYYETVDPETGKVKAKAKFPVGADPTSIGLERVDKPKIKDEAPPPAPEPEAPKAEPEKPESKPSKLSPGKRVYKVDAVQVGDAVTWEHDGKRHVGRIVDTVDGNFYVQTMDPETGEIADLFVFGGYDLGQLDVAGMADEDLPAKAKAAKIPPKPKEPELPPEPERPEAKPIAKPSEAKIGQHVEWEFNGKTYRGEVVSFEPDGRFRVKVYHPPGSSSVGKTPSFDEKKISDRKARIIDVDAIKDYETKVEERSKKVNDLMAAHHKAVKEWEKEKAKHEGKKEGAKRPAKKAKAEHVRDAPKSWDPDHEILRMADDLVPAYREKFKSFLDKQREKLKAAAESAYFSGADKLMWDERSVGEKILARSAHEYGHKFMDEVLTPEEREAWTRVIKEWQGSSSSYGGHRLMGALEDMGVEGEMKTHDKGFESYRAEGAKDKVLQRAIAKAMAYAQAVFDSLGVERVTLYRGGKSSTSDLDEASPGDLVELPHARELTSFSMSPDTAYGFGVYRMKVRIPAIRAFISPVTYPPLGAGAGAGSGYDENEYILAGLSGEKVKKMPKEKYDYDPEVMKMAAAKGAVEIDLSQDDEDDWSRHMRDARRERPESKKASAALLALARRSPELRSEILRAVGTSRSASQVARTILDQMGGSRRLSIMLGMRDMRDVEMLPRGVAFRWPSRHLSRGNKVMIDLTPSDTYNMTFLSSSARGEKPVKVYRDVYAEDLVPLFEKQTGWFLRL